MDNKEIEKISDEEVEQVAGGIDIIELSKESRKIPGGWMYTNFCPKCYTFFTIRSSADEQAFNEHVDNCQGKSNSN